MEVVIRRIGPNFLMRIYNGWKFGVPVVLALFTATRFILPENFSFHDRLSTSAGIVLIGVFVAYGRGRLKLLPSTIVDELSEDRNYLVRFCSNNGLREADKMTKPYFGRGFIPFDQIEQWRLRNEKGFVQIDNAEGVLCACFVILGLEHSFLDQFTAGRLTEHDIDSDVILPFDSMKKEQRIYVSGVVVRDPNKHIGHKRATIMLWVMLQYIKRVFGLKKTRTFYALGITRESESLLKGVGFDVCGSKSKRKDGSNLYRIDLDKKKWGDLVARIGDYSKMVSFNID